MSCKKSQVWLRWCWIFCYRLIIAQYAYSIIYAWCNRESLKDVCWSWIPVKFFITTSTSSSSCCLTVSVCEIRNPLRYEIRNPLGIAVTIVDVLEEVPKYEYKDTANRSSVTSYPSSHPNFPWRHHPSAHRDTGYTARHRCRERGSDHFVRIAAYLPCISHMPCRTCKMYNNWHIAST